MEDIAHVRSRHYAVEANAGVEHVAEAERQGALFLVKAAHFDLLWHVAAAQKVLSPVQAWRLVQEGGAARTPQCVKDGGSE